MKKDGGPAFPPHVAEIHGIATNSAEFGMPGMSLRDYFAAKALAGQMAYEGAEGCGLDQGSRDVAAWCYELADAMLAERAK
jgi:hypothetical protein